MNHYREKLYSENSNVFEYHLVIGNYNCIWSYISENKITTYVFYYNSKKKKIIENNDINETHCFNLMKLCDTTCSVLDGECLEYRFLKDGKKYNGDICIECQNIESKKEIDSLLYKLEFRSPPKRLIPLSL